MPQICELVSLLKVGARRFTNPNDNLLRTALRAERSSLSSNVWKIPIEDGKLGNMLKIFSQEGKVMAEAECNVANKVKNLTLYEYAPTNFVRRTHSFGTPSTTYTDVLRCTGDGEIISNIGVNRSHEYVQKVMDKNFGTSIPEYVKLWEKSGVSAEGTRVGVSAYSRNSEAITQQNNTIEKILKMFGFTKNDLA